jgi:hypothetical protein
MGLRPAVPVAVCKDARVGGDVEAARDRRREPRKRSRPGPRIESLYVAAAEPRPERSLSECHSIWTAMRQVARTL